jgi:6-phosphogluconolactonase (cycloisomerase 2 family)
MYFESLTNTNRLGRAAMLAALIGASACTDRAPLAPAVNASPNAAPGAVADGLASDERGAVGGVFVATNDASANAVIAFSRAADGTLTSLGTFGTGGRGVGGTADPLASQFALTLSPDRQYLFAVNAGSNDVTAFRVTSAGLQFLARVASGGVRPVSVAASAHTLYVLNAGDNTIGIFAWNGDGTVEPLGVRALSAGAAGGAAIRLSRNGRTLTVTERESNTIDGFAVDANGALSAPLTTPSTGAGPFGFDYALGGELIVSDAGTGATTSYTQSLDGTIALLDGPASTEGQGAPCWVVVTGDGRFAYVANAGGSSISGFAIGQRGQLTLLTPGGRTGDLGTGAQPLDLDLSRDSRFLYVLENGTGKVGAFAVQPNGTLVHLADTPGLTASAGFMGLAAF